MKKKSIETSVEAYRSLDPDKLAEIYQQIIIALSNLKEANTEQIAKFLKIDHQKVWKRVSELEKANLIYRPGNKRPTKTGRQSFTWMLAGETAEKLQNRERALGGESLADHSRKITTIVREHERKTKKPQQPEYTNKLF